MEKYIEGNKAAWEEAFANEKAKELNLPSIDHRGYPLSMILQGNKQ